MENNTADAAPGYMRAERDSRMKVGVISDIHSNILAFRACIEYMEKQGCDEYLFLGDYVSDTPYTRETMDLLYDFIEEHTCHLLRGNREEYMLSQHEVQKNGPEEQKWLYNSASGNLLYTYERLQEKDFLFFKSLPISFVYEKEGYPAITCCHGSPVNARELLELDEEAVHKWLAKIPTEYLLCAHTHFPGARIYEGKHYFNSGCVGISIHDAGYAQCMILHSAQEGEAVTWEPEFLRIPYDNHRVAEEIVTKGLLAAGKWFANSNIMNLLTGIDRTSTLVKLAEKMAAEAGEKTQWPHIEEKYFAMAAKKLQIPDYRELSF